MKLSHGLAVLVLICSISSGTLIADQFHYHNIIVGDRAMGLGGAFTAIADDASAMIYNPAGLGFALSNDISGSANALYQRKVVYKKAIGTRDFTEKSSGTLAPFFGGLQKLDHLLPGLAMALGMNVGDSELKDQDDLITDFGTLERFHRTANVRASTTTFSVAAGKRVLSNLSLGFGLGYSMIDELTQDYQDVKYKSSFTCKSASSTQARPNWPVCDANPYNNQVFLQQNGRFHLKGTALETSFGTQLALGTWSFGANVRLRNLMSESYEEALDIRTNKGSPNEREIVDGETRFIVGNMLQASPVTKYTDPLGKMANEIRTGFAWFPTTTLLWSFDVIHNTAAESKMVAFSRNAVTNFATGAEYYITPSIPMRVGIFTNYDARPKVSSTGKGIGGVVGIDQLDHIDYTGYSLFGAWVQPNSQLAGGVILQTGEGKAQKVSGTAIQTVEAQSYTFAISATHSF